MTLKFKLRIMWMICTSFNTRTGRFYSLHHGTLNVRLHDILTKLRESIRFVGITARFFCSSNNNARTRDFFIHECLMFVALKTRSVIPLYLENKQHEVKRIDFIELCNLPISCGTEPMTHSLYFWSCWHSLLKIFLCKCFSAKHVLALMMRST